ncbi:hypothetical protein [Methylobacterium durans]|nr:hypothetical protein [Methylobacterium durans]
MTLIVGALLLAMGIGLVVFAMPKRSGKQPAFLRRDAAFVPYPAICLVFVAFGAALIISSIV